MATRTLTPAPAELDRWRRDTPGCRDRIHLNNAGAGLMPRPVLDALTEHLAREAAIGGYEAADEAEPRVRETYALVARLVGAAPNNIALVENATVAFSQALSAFDFRPGDRIVTTRTDYPSNQLMYLSLAQRAGVETVRADDLPEGGVDPESVRRLARDPRTRLVALSWVPTRPTGTPSAWPTVPAASRTGSSPTPSSSASGPPPATHSRPASSVTTEPGGSRHGCASGSTPCPRDGCSTAAGSGAPSSRSTFGGTTPVTSSCGSASAASIPARPTASRVCSTWTTSAPLRCSASHRITTIRKTSSIRRSLPCSPPPAPRPPALAGPRRPPARPRPPSSPEAAPARG